ncbi:MAG: AAA family ATPase [Candidatus Schekmanbacteria bacterium]|nr:AAA family ATPase [Candidatus Schekmanbacteria bacterium]
MAEWVGPYEKRTPLGRGGVGVVCAARRRGSGEIVALKTMHVDSARARASIRREIRVLAEICHPGIVRIVDHGVDQGLPWYAMQLVEGTDLAAYCRGVCREAGDLGKALPSLLGVFRLLCLSLAYLHGEGLVHCDLKPANVLVRADGMPVLVDFGFVARFGGAISREVLDSDSGISGTLYYMAPERIRGGLVDARADLYAVGCILYEVLTGHPPFVGGKAREVLAGHLGQRAPAPSWLARQVPRGLDELTMRLLEKDPSDRPGYAQDIAAAMERLGAARKPDRELPAPRTFLVRAAVAGRDRELALLKNRLNLASVGRGGIVLLGGESGIGKTRLAMELAREASAHHFAVLAGDCQPPAPGSAAAQHALGRPMQAFVRPLEAMADTCREAGEQVIKRVLGARAAVLGQYQPCLGDLLPGQRRHPPPSELPPDAAARRLFACLAEALAELGTVTPVLLVIDDLQWADDLSLHALRFLAMAARLDRRRVLVLATFRTEESVDEIDELSVLQGVERVKLEPLDRVAIGQMIGTTLSLKEAPVEFAASLARHSEGNPFFVAEYLRMAVNVGVLWRNASGAWCMDQGAGREEVSGFEALPLPASIGGLLQQRLAALGPLSRRLAEAAAVVGDGIDEEMLARVSGDTIDEVATALRELHQRQVIVARQGELRFVHERLREVCYALLDARQRAALHRLAADGVEAAQRLGRDPNLGALANHWRQCGEKKRACATYLAAAEQAQAAAALGDADNYLTTALADCATSPSEVAALLRKRGTVRELYGRAADALGDLDAAADAFRSMDDRAQAAACRLSAAAIHVRAQAPQAGMDCAQEALELAELAGDDRSAATARMYDGVARWMQGDRATARERLQQALIDARALDDRDLEVRILGYLGLFALERGTAEEAIHHANAALERAREGEPNVRVVVALLLNLGSAHGRSGNPVAARSAFEEALALSRRSGDVFYTAEAIAHLGALVLNANQYRDALPYFEEAYGIFNRIGEHAGALRILNNMAIIHHDMGLLGRAWRDLDTVVAAHEKMGNLRALAWSRYNLALCLLDCGQPVSAAEHLRAGTLACRAVGDRYRLAECLQKLGEVAWAAGRPEDAMTAWREVEGLATDTGYVAMRCSAQGWLRLAKAAGPDGWPGIWTIVGEGWPIDGEALFRSLVLGAVDGAIRNDVGNPELAACLQALREVEQVLTSRGARRDGSKIFRLAAELLSRLGDADGAERAMTRAREEVALIVQELEGERRAAFCSQRGVRELLDG